MEQFSGHFKNGMALHHAYIIEGEKETVVKQLAVFFEKDLGIALANNPDYLCEQFDTFGIDEARLLSERQSRMSALGPASAEPRLGRGVVGGHGRKIFVICAGRVTVEAQNALLKTLEEPTAGTHIFIIVPSAVEMLPTVRSRAHVLTLNSPFTNDARAFLAARRHERGKYFHDIAENQDRAGAFFLMQALEGVVRHRFRQSGDAVSYYASAKALEQCRRHLGGRAPSLKMLLEYLAISLPRISE